MVTTINTYMEDSENVLGPVPVCGCAAYFSQLKLTFALDTQVRDLA